MTILYLTTAFHGNLCYSSISEARYKEVITTCYWPLLSLAQDLQIPLGFEFSGKTLEILQKLDPELLAKIKFWWQSGHIEIIGSGYVQSIFPLIPSEINKRNLQKGNEVYKRLLGKQPRIALVNEQCYAAGLVPLYQEAGYEGIIIDWVNATKYNDYPEELQYTTPLIQGCGRTTRVLWNNSIAFQKLQRYVFGDLSLQEYLSYIFSHYSPDHDRYLMVYSNDMEIFNFRPRDPKSLHSGFIKSDEIMLMKQAFSSLKSDERITFVTPSHAALKFTSPEIITPETAQYPILCKKQDKYNLSRWAVCGRENSKSNSLCYQAYSLLKLLQDYGKDHEEEWNKLIELWASDYRTHTTPEKWDDFRQRLLLFIAALKKKGDMISPNGKSLRNSKILPTNSMPVDGTKFLLPEEFKAEEFKTNEFTRDQNSKRNQSPIIDEQRSTVETSTVLLRLNGKKGGTIGELIFKEVTPIPVIKLLPQGYFKDVSYAADFFSGHSTIFLENRQLTDLGATSIRIEETQDKILLSCTTEVGEILSIQKVYALVKTKPLIEVNLSYKLKRKITPSFFRTAIITLNPECFDRNSLSYKTVNGGQCHEIFRVNGPIDQATPLNLGVSSHHCLGSTDGWISVGDSEKELIFMTNKSQTYSVPLIHFDQPKRDHYFFRIYNSISETDDTTKTSFRGTLSFTYWITARKILH